MNDIVRKGFVFHINPSYSDFSSGNVERCKKTQSEIDKDTIDFLSKGGKVQYIEGVDSTPAVPEKTFTESNYSLDKKLGIKGLAKKLGITSKKAREKKIQDKLDEGYMKTRDFKEASGQSRDTILKDINKNIIKGSIAWANCRLIPTSMLAPYMKIKQGD